MFLSFFNKEAHFDIMWDNIKKYSVEPATLMQFLFNNRNNDDITSRLEEFYKVAENKNLKHNNVYT
jgi:hypothetical protein